MTLVLKTLVGCLLGLFILVSAGVPDAEEPLVYTALEDDEIPGYLEIFKKAHSDIEVKIVRDYQNAIQLQVFPLESMIKIGDTISDIQEGCNAGMWTIGLTQSGNELGLPQDWSKRWPPTKKSPAGRYRSPLPGSRRPLCGRRHLGVPGIGRQYQPAIGKGRPSASRHPNQHSANYQETIS